MTRYLLEFCAQVLLVAVVAVVAHIEEPVSVACLAGGLMLGAIVAGRAGYRRGHIDERARAARIREQRAAQQAQATTRCRP